MSPRSIFFGQKGIHWECQQGLSCEFDTDIKRGHCSGPDLGECLKAEYAEMRHGKLDTPEVHSIWGRLVDEYSAMHLSHAEDVLVAIAGISSTFEVQLRSKSTYGLWVDFLVKELLWTQEGPENASKYHSSAKFLPSWSWISAHGTRIQMSNIITYPCEKDEFYSADLISWPSDAGFNVQFLQGPRDIRLCIRGYLSSYVESEQDENHGTSSRGSGEDGVGEWQRHDRLDHGAPETDLFRLLLICQRQESRVKHFNHGLVLTPVNHKERLYRRVGYTEERFCGKGSPDAPASSWVQGKFPVNLWAPLEEEQEVYIV
ncbi:hypothetical protein E8E13_010244 [Curvularia kusanoi]|uniref:Heterokaryon incompatibility domain-containing protein n=1 Tax=Curvularia kusanoi TaxID=90978 RepID=A0A9P4TNX0_CURKU|nr:hypothetical protein E8E13_010244 [Curvularia kusanoi]